ncbi:MAG: TonB-dependent receptor [Bacteroidales bacterium]|nr:TonB-dependent receptor [Bacteroidales bacterium]
MIIFNIFLKKHHTLLLVILLASLMSVTAQEKLSIQARTLVTSNTGVIACSIIDEDGQALEYATVTVFSLKDSSMVTGAITNARGICLIDKVPWGSYYLRISYIGYANKYVNNITLTVKNPIYQLTKQKIMPGQQMIEGVTVRAEKEMIQTNLDKKVFNVDKNITSEGATCLEVLENIPSVDVDVEGNVSLRGSQSVTILVDNRPTHLTLDQIPSGMVESIELITNPSARYEPDGVSGIINVVLKKTKEKGFNGMITVGSGASNLDSTFFFGKNNLSANVNYRYNKVNVFANYNFRMMNRNNYNTLDRASVFNNDTNRFYQMSRSRGEFMSHNIRTGLDYYLNKKNTLSLNLNFSKFERLHRSNSDSRSSFNNIDTADKEYILDSRREFANYNLSSNIFYKHDFNKKGQELTASVYYTRMWGGNELEGLETYSIPSDREDFINKTVTLSDNHFVTAQVDFVTPVGNGGRIETGYKLTSRFTDQEYHQYIGSKEDNLIESASDANNYNYNEYINALYFIYSNTIREKFKYQVGLRGELANNTFYLKNIDTTSRSIYPHLFPTLHLVYEFNEKHSIFLSYSMRVQRPNIFQLNPYVNNSDRFNLSKGNPSLKPELTNSVELGYQYYTEKSSVTTNVFYRHRYQMISRYTELLNDSVSLTSYQNFNQAQSYGIELNYAQTIFKWWRANINGSFYQTLIDSTQGMDMIDPNLMKDWSWNVRGMFSFILPKDFDIQLTASYRSPMLTTGSMGGFGWGGGSGQGRMEEQWVMDIGFKKMFLKKTLTLSVRVSDIFASRTSRINTFGHNEMSSFDTYSFRKNDSRQLFISLSYRINNYRPKRVNYNNEMEDYYYE